MIVGSATTIYRASNTKIGERKGIVSSSRYISSGYNSSGFKSSASECVIE